jgi:FkbM family methyltransferase
MKFCDFIEIGTSDFDTEIQKNDTRFGVSVEPIKYYLDRLPNKQNCTKLNMAVSDYTGTCIVHYLSESTIDKYGFPYWVRGCNSINSYHKTVTDVCNYKSLDIKAISENDEVDVKPLYEIMNTLCIDGVYFLKIDTEGHDCVILKKFFDDIQTNMRLPHVIQFESNVLSNEADINHIIEIFTKKGYDLVQKDSDTVLNLNLNRISKKQEFTEGIPKYYIMDYPPNYSTSNLPHENTLEGAKQYCIQHNCSGITLQDGIYQVRGGRYMKYYDGDICSWVLL